MNLFHTFIDSYNKDHEPGDLLSPQTQLHLPLLLIRTSPAGELVRTETEEVNMEGFCCYAKECFALGEQLYFVLKLPSAASRALAADTVYLSGLVQVVLISAADALEKVGIGCQVKHYRVMSLGDDLAAHSEAIRNFLQFGI